MPKDNNDKPFETVRIIDSQAQQVQPFPASLLGVPIPSSGSSFGGNTQASYVPEQEYSPEENSFNDQAQQSFFSQENGNGGQELESNYPEETGQQFSQPNFERGAENFDGLRSAAYQSDNDRMSNNFEGGMLASESNEFR